MAFPVVPTAAASTLLQSNQATATTTHTFPNQSSLPNTPHALLLAIIVTYLGASTDAEFSGWPAGWSEFIDQAANSSTVQAIGGAYKLDATGSESGTFNITSVGSTRSVMFLMEIVGASLTTAPQATPKANGTSAAADPAALDPSTWASEDTLWIAVAVNGETSLTGSFTGITAAPTNYTGYLDSGIIGGDVIGALEGAVAFRQLNTGSENVGVWSLDVGAAGNSALLIAIRPMAPVALTVADASQDQTVDNLALTQHQVLAIADASQAQTVDNLALTQHQILVVADASQSQTVDNLTLTASSGVQLEVADASQAQTVDNLALTQHHILAVSDASQAQTVDNLALTQHHILVVNDAAQGQTVDNIVLTQHQVLTVADASQQQTVDNLVLTQHQVLAVADAVQQQTVDNLVLIPAGAFIVFGAVQQQTVDNLVLVQHHVLTVNDAAQAQTVDNLALLQHHILTVNDAVQQQTVESLALLQHHILAVNDVSQAQTADNLVLQVVGGGPDPALKSAFMNFF